MLGGGGEGGFGKGIRGVFDELGIEMGRRRLGMVVVNGGG